MTARRRRQDRDVAARVAAFNRGRDPDVLPRKYAALAESPFRFFRGTAHLFWADWRRSPPDCDAGPRTWCCGDLHLENFGSFRGDNGLGYFDINDFDESAQGPALADPLRCLTSIWLAAAELGRRRADARRLAAAFLDAYCGALADGRARWVERATAEGVVRDLLDDARLRTDAELLARRTRGRGRNRRIAVDGERTLPAAARERDAVAAAIHRETSRGADAGAFAVLDVARRLAGTGSLGVRRYVVLVRGRGGAGRLLDVKEARPSSLAAAIRGGRVAWTDDAERVVTTQRRMQAASPALLRAIRIGGAAFVLRELQPLEDRLSLKRAARHGHRLRHALATMGRLTAWAQLRSSGHGGSAPADDLIAFAARGTWRAEALRFSRACASAVTADWKRFVAAQRGRAARGERPATS